MEAIVDQDGTELLRAIPQKYATPDPATLSQIPKGNVKLDYMGHADVTLALIDVDPEWTWEPAGFDAESGGPAVVKQGNRLVMWGYLTILGVKRLCVGTCEASKTEPEKELIGDLLRNGAMRFGVATNLWSKAARDGDHSADPYGSGGSGGYERPQRRTGADESAEPTLEQQVAVEFSKLPAAGKQALIAAAKELGVANIMRSGEHAQTLLDAIEAAR